MGKPKFIGSCACTLCRVIRGDDVVSGSDNGRFAHAIGLRNFAVKILHKVINI